MSLVEKSGGIHFEKRNGNLHVKVKGRFGVDTAMEVTSRIARKYQTGGNVFIHTGEITAVSPQSREMFKSMLGVYGLPAKNIYLMGEKGFDICHEKGRVIMRKQIRARDAGAGVQVVQVKQKKIIDNIRRKLCQKR